MPMVILYGFYSYYKEKIVEYKDNWDMAKFIFGVKKCRLGDH